MAASINFELRVKKKNARGECPIYLRATYNRKNAWMSTGLKIESKYWDEETQRTRRSYDRYKVLNHELDTIEGDAIAAKLRLKQIGRLDAKGVINRVKGYNTENFFTYAEKFVKGLEAQGKRRSAKNANVIINKVRKYNGSENLTLNEIDQNFLAKLQAYLRTEHDNASNTIRKNFKQLRQILEASKKEKYIHTNPFDNFDLPSYQKPRKVALSIGQINRLEKLKLKKGSTLWHTRNWFMFSFYNAGIRFGDLCLLKRKNIKEGRLIYLMSKTTHNSEPKWKNIKLLPQALEILEAYNYQQMKPDDYIFPIVDPERDLDDPDEFAREKASRNTIMNKNLDRLANKAKIKENITTHIARHSFANYARKKGMSIYSISKALAHSDLKTTEHYLASFDEEMLDNEMEELFS